MIKRLVVVASASTGSAVVLAELTANSGIPLRNILLGILGSFIIIVLAWHGFGALATREYGRMFGSFGLALPVIAFTFFPDESMNVLKGIAAAIFG